LMMIHGTHECLFKLNQSENFQEHYQVTQGDRSEWYGNHMEILDSKSDRHNVHMVVVKGEMTSTLVMSGQGIRKVCKSNRNVGSVHCAYAMCAAACAM
jgi:hypothetical protein